MSDQALHEQTIQHEEYDIINYNPDRDTFKRALSTGMAIAYQDAIDRVELVKKKIYTADEVLELLNNCLQRESAKKNELEGKYDAWMKAKAGVIND